MKQNIFTAILVVIIAATSLPIQGQEAQDPSSILENARRSMRLPQAIVTDIENGTTSIDGINFFLCKGRFPETVDGVIIARKAVLRDSVNLAVKDDKGNLLLSCPLDAEPEEGFSIFFFTLSNQLASGAILTFFPSDGMYELQLNKVAPRTETVLKLKPEEIIERLARIEEENSSAKKELPTSE
jgi:hypothetical protein